MSEDFKNGLALINLLEVLAEEKKSKNKMGTYNKSPKMAFHMYV